MEAWKWGDNYQDHNYPHQVAAHKLFSQLLEYFLKTVRFKIWVTEPAMRGAAHLADLAPISQPLWISSYL